jgi:outer membrane lipoprotein SlyB
MNDETESKTTANEPSSERDEKSDAVTTGAEEGSTNRDPITGTPGSHPVATAVGTTSGAIAGALAGAIAGPAGVAVGGVIGAIVGATAGHGSGEELNPTSDEAVESDVSLDDGA